MNKYEIMATLSESRTLLSLKTSICTEKVCFYAICKPSSMTKNSSKISQKKGKFYLYIYIEEYCMNPKPKLSER